MKNVIRALNNFSSVPMWTTTLNKVEVEYMLGELSGTVFCQGLLRELVATKITDNLYKITSKPA